MSSDISMLVASVINYFSGKGEVLSPEAAEGNIRSWESGHGELPAELMNGHEEWYPIMESYCKANGHEFPESWKTPLVVPPSNPSQAVE